MDARPANVLAEKEPNTTAPVAGRDDKADGFSYRKALQKPLNGSYVSPSDAVMSPCSQKLWNHKTKIFARAKPKTLFAPSSRSRALEFEDIKTDNTSPEASS